MDSLRPDRDDLDLYNSRKNKSAKAGQKKVEKKAQQIVRPEGAQFENGEQARGSSRVQAAPVAPSKNSPLVILLLLIMLIASLGLSYLYWQQSQTVASLEQRLLSADEFIGQSKLLFARLEGEVSETGAELLQTGTSAEKKMAFLESEVRKLWGVAYDRNRKTLQEHTKELESIQKATASVKKKIAAQETTLAKVQAESKKGLSMLDGRVASLSGEFSITRAEQDDFIKQLEKKLADYEADSVKANKLLEVVQGKLDESIRIQVENKESLSSIDESRRQLIKRVIDLESRLGKIAVSKTNSTPGLP